MCQEEELAWPWMEEPEEAGFTEEWKQRTKSTAKHIASQLSNVKVTLTPLTIVLTGANWYRGYAIGWGGWANRIEHVNSTVVALTLRLCAWLQNIATLCRQWSNRKMKNRKRMDTLSKKQTSSSNQSWEYVTDLCHGLANQWARTSMNLTMSPRMTRRWIQEQTLLWLYN